MSLDGIGNLSRMRTTGVTSPEAQRNFLDLITLEANKDAVDAQVLLRDHSSVTPANPSYLPVPDPNE